MHAADSDSVNLGSNPSPPAKEIPANSALLARGHGGHDCHVSPDGRTEVGTVLDAVDAARPHLRFITASIRRALPTSSPDDIKGQLDGLEARLVGGV